jgi:hypothetical protein
VLPQAEEVVVAVAEEVETGVAEVAGTTAGTVEEVQRYSELETHSVAVAAGVFGTPAAGHIQEIPSAGLVERDRRSQWVGDRKERAAVVVAAAVEIAEKTKVAGQNLRVLDGRCSLLRERHWIGNTWQKRRAMQKRLN